MPLDYNPFCAESDSGATAESDGNGHNDSLDGERKTSLVALANTLGLDTYGSRTDLITRIRAHQLTVANDEH